MSDRLSEIAEREKAATPEPWSYDGVHPEICYMGTDPKRNDTFWLICSECRAAPDQECSDDQFGHYFDNNFVFIAHARADIPWLLANTQQALALIRSVRDERGWKEVPLGVLNQIEAILLGDTNETENHDGK